MMERGRFSPPPQRQQHAPSYGSGHIRDHKNFGEEAEEGLIPQDEDGIFQAAD